jgi:hypothetical protein
LLKRKKFIRKQSKQKQSFGALPISELKGGVTAFALTCNDVVSLAKYTYVFALIGR